MIKSRLGLFFWSFSQFTILQIIRSFKSFNHPYALSMLVASSGWIQFMNPESVPVSILMMTAFIGLSIIEGSLSNHVVCSATLAGLVLACFSQDHILFSSKVRSAVCAFVAILYLVTGIHKLNYGFFDPKHSCASLYIAGSASALPEFILQKNVFIGLLSHLVMIAPLGATIFELGMGLILAASSFHTRNSVLKYSVLIGSAFHAILSLPPPPLSVYPFSAIMIPVYVFIIPENIAIERFIDPLIRSVYVKGFIGIIFAVSHKYLPIFLFGEQILFEYPNYDLWGVSVVWNLLWWSVIIAACLRGPVEPAVSQDAKRLPFLSKLILVLFALFALTPYIGLRNYPALAMFSNLRTEGHKPNQWTLDWDIFDYQKDWVEIIDTNISSLKNYQVDLGYWFPRKLSNTLDKFGLNQEFIICPPRWDIDNPNSYSFKDFNIPFIELRRRVSDAITHAKLQPVYVEYIHHFPNGEVSNGRFESNNSIGHEISKPLSLFERFFVRFRAFSNNYSPCRH